MLLKRRPPAVEEALQICKVQRMCWGLGRQCSAGRSRPLYASCVPAEGFQELAGQGRQESRALNVAQAPQDLQTCPSLTAHFWYCTAGGARTAGRSVAVTARRLLLQVGAAQPLKCRAGGVLRVPVQLSPLVRQLLLCRHTLLALLPIACQGDLTWASFGCRRRGGRRAANGGRGASRCAIANHSAAPLVAWRARGLCCAAVLSRK